ncbi:type II secretion system F family protein [bacterium]|nr:type II secretion system F family protein [bacterium]
MPIFVYEALDSQGQEVRGEIEAVSSEEAIVKIRNKSYFPTNVKEKSAKRARAAGGGRKKKRTFALGRVKAKNLCTFTRQLSTLQDAGLPIVRSLKILEEQQKPGVLKNQLVDVAEDVEGGSTLSEALSKHPKTFDKLYVNMVRAGEAGGVLDSILERLAAFMEKSQRLKKQVISALIYPAAVISVAGAILAAIMIFIIPKFKDMFDDMRMELPALTNMLVNFSHWLKNFWYLLPLIPFSFFVILKLIASNKTGRFIIDKVKLKMPLFGMIISKSIISRFARTLGTLIASGVPILEALSIVKDATGNAVFENAIGNVHDSIREGENIVGPLAAAKVVDSMVLNMVDVGEETGELDKMLLKIADTYDEDVDALVGGLMSLIEPLLIVFLGGAVGFIVVALFMPLVSLMQNIGQ